jgi:hypothetical protein
MRNRAGREGRDFLESLALYLNWRIEKTIDPTKKLGREPTGHLAKYEVYLKALGVQPQLRSALMKHMRDMKRAGRVPEVPARG